MSARSSYGLQQVSDDFLHILSVHISEDNREIQNLKFERNDDQSVASHTRKSIRLQMAEYFMEIFPCGLGIRNRPICEVIKRHLRPRQTSSKSLNVQETQYFERALWLQQYGTTCTEDILFQSEIDKIHVYFLQFGVRASVCMYVILFAPINIVIIHEQLVDG